MSGLRERMEVACELAWSAGRLTLGYFQRPLAVDLKADRSPVTEADREAEAYLRAALQARYPADGILGEERGETPGKSGYVWTVDPIDGTKSFIQGVPLYGVLVGCLDPKGDAVVGAACFPALGELVAAARGEGCYWNGRRARVSETSKLEEACVLYTGPECLERAGAAGAVAALRACVRLVRGWGDAYGHVLVATGRAEAMLDPILAPWDIVPLVPIVEEAGGVFTDWAGRRTAHGASGVSTNERLAAAVRGLLRTEGGGT